MLPAFREFANVSRNIFARIEKISSTQGLGGRFRVFRESGAVFADSCRGEADGAASFFFRLFNAASDVRG